MINIITKSLHFDNELKKKIEFVCSFCNTNSMGNLVLSLNDNFNNRTNFKR